VIGGRGTKHKGARWGREGKGARGEEGSGGKVTGAQNGRVVWDKMVFSRCDLAKVNLKGLL